MGGATGIREVARLEVSGNSGTGGVELVKEPFLDETLLPGGLRRISDTRRRDTRKHTSDDELGIKDAFWRTPSRSTRSMRKRQNFVAFQSLLQNFRYPSTREISMLTF